MRKGSRHEVRGEEKRDPILRFLDELKMLFFVKFSELSARLRAQVPSAGRLLPPPSALKLACVLMPF